MAGATKIIGTVAGGAWTLLFAQMVLISLRPIGYAEIGSIAASIIVPALVAVTAFWIAFRSDFRAKKRALVVQILFLTVAAFCWLVVAAASGG
ncbi:hypothetical protein NX02_24350 [Sphingomonas sanxanigenens DSM 19645 = NX02]|uniref:Uncharacterized protein n=1 Tax=Sphingomonas sanxanigenens DSM 19645 = NX02 TaxID=1123269 RepID=W0AIW3_9SPHN|nr:hypothetical protein NX02_24350 [Sphingomonas sanxanigenens DSM 19645 = NX02]